MNTQKGFSNIYIILLILIIIGFGWFYVIPTYDEMNGQKKRADSYRETENTTRITAEKFLEKYYRDYISDLSPRYPDKKLPDYDSVICAKELPIDFKDLTVTFDSTKNDSSDFAQRQVTIFERTSLPTEVYLSYKSGWQIDKIICPVL
jgi:hypothetical protein